MHSILHLLFEGAPKNIGCVLHYCKPTALFFFHGWEAGKFEEKKKLDTKWSVCAPVSDFFVGENNRRNVLGGEEGVDFRTETNTCVFYCMLIDGDAHVS